MAVADDVIDLRRGELLRVLAIDGVLGVLDLDEQRDTPLWVGDELRRELAEHVARFPTGLGDPTLVVCVDDDVFRVRRGGSRCVVLVFPRGHDVVRRVARLLRDLTDSRDAARSHDPVANDAAAVPPALLSRFREVFPDASPADEGVHAMASADGSAWAVDEPWGRAMRMTLDLHRLTPARRVSLNLLNHRVISMRAADRLAAIAFGLALGEEAPCLDVLSRLLDG